MLSPFFKNKIIAPVPAIVRAITPTMRAGASQYATDEQIRKWSGLPAPVRSNFSNSLAYVAAFASWQRANDPNMLAPGSQNSGGDFIFDTLGAITGAATKIIQNENLVPALALVFTGIGLSNALASGVSAGATQTSFAVDLSSPVLTGGTGAGQGLSAVTLTSVPGVGTVAASTAPGASSGFLSAQAAAQGFTPAAVATGFTAETVLPVTLAFPVATQTPFTMQQATGAVETATGALTTAATVAKIINPATPKTAPVAISQAGSFNPLPILLALGLVAKVFIFT